MEEKKQRIRKDSECLAEFMRRFSRNERVVIVDKLVVGCLVPRQTIHNWIHGLCRIPELHKCKIEEIVGEKVFENPTNCEK